jgi:transposase-like protein
VNRKRKSPRPSLDILLNEVQELGYCATGRKYGVTDNAIRKWIKSYQKVI